jgi:hypothetical protein
MGQARQIIADRILAAFADTLLTDIPDGMEPEEAEQCATRLIDRIKRRALDVAQYRPPEEEPAPVPDVEALTGALSGLVEVVDALRGRVNALEARLGAVNSETPVAQLQMMIEAGKAAEVQAAWALRGWDRCGGGWSRLAVAGTVSVRLTPGLGVPRHHVLALQVASPLVRYTWPVVVEDEEKAKLVADHLLMVADFRLAHATDGASDGG